MNNFKMTDCETRKNENMKFPEKVDLPEEIKDAVFNALDCAVVDEVENQLYIAPDPETAKEFQKLIDIENSGFEIK